MKIVEGFSNSVTVRGGIRKPEITVRRGMINFAGPRGIDSRVDGNLRRSAFDHLNLFQSEKQQSANIEHLLKSKLV